MSNLTRKEDWPELMNAFIDSRRGKPFVWGENDCCLFACDCVLAMTGTDLAAAYRGQYQTALGAMRAIKPHGGVYGAFENAASAYGIEQRPAAYAQRGDVVTTETEHGPALGICLSDCAVFVGVTGLTFLPMSECRNTWRI